MNRYHQPVRFDLASGLSSRRFPQFMTVAGSSAVLSTALHGVRGIHPPLSQSKASDAAIRMGVVADRCSLVVTDAFRDRLPNDVIDILSRISLDVDAVTAMDYLTNVEGPSPREAATQWMEENPDIVQSWLTPAA